MSMGMGGASHSNSIAAFFPNDYNVNKMQTIDIKKNEDKKK